MSGPTTTKKCKRPGCFKDYVEEENEQGKCHYHSGMPIFHDTKKGWTCCNKIVYDWDEFQKLPTCSVAQHTDVKQDGKQQFYKSTTVSNAAGGLEKAEAQKVVIQDITKYNLEVDAKKQKEQEQKVQKLFTTKEGKLRCINQGCRKDFLETENQQEACNFHKGQAVFHDLKKYWTCCGKETHDWDQFMKLPTCSVGFHSPKYV